MVHFLSLIYFPCFFGELNMGLLNNCILHTFPSFLQNSQSLINSLMCPLNIVHLKNHMFSNTLTVHKQHFLWNPLCLTHLSLHSWQSWTHSSSSTSSSSRPLTLSAGVVSSSSESSLHPLYGMIKPQIYITYQSLSSGNYNVMRSYSGCTY